MSKQSYGICLAGVLLLGMGLRFGAYLAVMNEPLTSDASEYAAVGRAVYEGNYVSYYWPPLTGFTVAGCMYLLGPSLAVQRLAGLIPSILGFLVMAAAARSAFSRRASLISTLIVAVLPGQLLFAVSPRTDAFMMLWVGLAMWTMRAWLGRPRWWLMLLYGLWTGLGGLTRAPLLFLGLACVWTIVVKYRNTPGRILFPAALATLGALLVVMPWSYRNYRVSGEWFLVSANGTRVLYHSNRPGSDRYLSYRAAQDKKGQYATAESLRLDAVANTVERTQAMKQAFLRHLREDPLDYVIRCMNRIRIMFSWDLAPISHFRRGYWGPIPRTVLLGLGVIHGVTTLLLTCLAAVYLLRCRQATAWVVGGSIAFLTLPYVLISAVPIYAMPLHAIYIMLAGRVLAKPKATFRFFRRNPKRLAIAVLVGVFLFVFSVEWALALYRAGPSL